MATYDWSAVSVAYNRTPPNFTAGELITLSVSGQVKKTDAAGTVTENTTLAVNLAAADGTTFAFTGLVPMQVTRTTPGAVTMLGVTIVSVTDSTGRVWTPAANGLSATATA